MKTFLLEIDTRPNSTLRLQRAATLADAAILAQNSGLQLRAVREECSGGAAALEQGGVKWGLAGVVMNWDFLKNA